MGFRGPEQPLLIVLNLEPNAPARTSAEHENTQRPSNALRRGDCRPAARASACWASTKAAVPPEIVIATWMGSTDLP